jgi:hypothetical protein
MHDTFLTNSQLLPIGFSQQPAHYSMPKNYIELKKLFSREEQQRMPNIIRETNLKTHVVHFDCNLIAATKPASSKSIFLAIWLRTNQRTKCEKTTKTANFGKHGMLFCIPCHKCLFAVAAKLNIEPYLSG